MRKSAKILATASYLPEKIVTNDDLSLILDTNHEWIHSRTGIKERRISTEENTSDLAIKVAKKLLAKSETDPLDIDFIILASMTADYQSPSTACIVQGAVGADNAWAADINAACSGFVYALNMAEKMLATGSSKGLVIASDVMSKVIDWSDRTTAVLFGDGAGGVLLEANEEKSFLQADLHSLGQKGSNLQSGYVGVSNPWAHESLHNEAKSNKLSMEGRVIFNFATGPVVKSIAKIKEKYEKDKQEIDYYLLHQANIRILDIVARKLKVDREKFLQNIENYGNTSSATIAILLDEAVSDGTLELGSGQKILLSGFGGGLTWANILMKI